MIKLYLDSADASIASLIPMYNLVGATSNPTILMRDNTLVDTFISRVPEGYACFVQLVETEYDAMINEALELATKHPHVIFKVPATPIGFRVIVHLRSLGFEVLATAIYSFEQAVMAVNCGANYVAPYVNRMDKMGLNGIEVTLKIQEMIRAYGAQCEVVGASFATSYQINSLIEKGVDSVTISLPMFLEYLENKSALKAVEQFKKDWETLVAQKK